MNYYKNLVISLLLLFFMFLIVLIMPTAHAQEIDFNIMFKALSDFMVSPTWKAVISVMGIFGFCFVYITKYFWNKNQREEDAFKYALKIRNELERNNEQMQKDVAKGTMDVMEVAYKQDFDLYVKVINEKRFEVIYMKTPEQFKEKIAAFIYNEKFTPEERSAMVINLVRRK